MTVSQWTLRWLVSAVLSAVLVFLRVVRHPLTRHETYGVVAVCLVMFIRQQTGRR